MDRANATEAKACILLTNTSNDESRSDHKNILLGLFIKKFVYHKSRINLPLCLQLINPESKVHFKSSLNIPSNDQLIILEEIKMNLLAKSCFCPGIICMISNLIASSNESQEMPHQWLKEYAQGMEHEIYRVEVSIKMQNHSFKEVAKRVYNKYNGKNSLITEIILFLAIIFALELQVDGKTIIRLNPDRYSFRNIIENNIHVYIICERKEIADQIATLDMTPEEIVYYKGPKKESESTKLSGCTTLLNSPYLYFKVEEEQDESDSSQKDENEEETLDEKSLYHVLEKEVPTTPSLILPPLLPLTTTHHPQPHNPHNALNQQSLMDITQKSIEGRQGIVNHIIVCGIHPSLYHFILPLRAKYLPEEQQHLVVLLNSEAPSKEIWDKISKFPKIMFIKGSPLIQEDLHRANINSADKTVVLGQDYTFKGKIKDEMQDAEAIFIYKTIKRSNPDVQVILELGYSSNIKYLLSNLRFNAGYQLSPLYASGEVYIASIIDTLTCQAYFNPHIVTILQQILIGGSNISNQIVNASEDLRQSYLWQITVPEQFVVRGFECEGHFFVFFRIRLLNSFICFLWRKLG